MGFNNCLVYLYRCILLIVLPVSISFYSISAVMGKGITEQKKEQSQEKKVKSKTAEKKGNKKKAKKNTPKKVNVKVEMTAKPKEVLPQVETKTPVKKEEGSHLPLLETKKTKAEKAAQMAAQTNENPTLIQTKDQEGRTIYEGAFGSRYVLNNNGKKLYLKPTK
jgi:hypothetical protein